MIHAPGDHVIGIGSWLVPIKAGSVRDLEQTSCQPSEVNSESSTTTELISMTGVKMADEKSQPTFVIATPQGDEQPKKSRLTKKHLVIAGVSLIIAALVIVGVLVGIRLYNDAQLEQLKLKYSMTMKDKDNNDVKQNVSADAEANIVQYNVEKDGVKATILQDFDKGIEVSRVELNSGVTCYVTALNRSHAQDPNSIPSSAPNPGDSTPSTQLVYKVDEKPLKDITYLGQRVVKMCQNVPTHWMVPSCDKGASNMNSTMPATNDRQKRATVCATCGGYYCVCGCCWAVCGRFSSSTYTWRYSNGVYYCTYYMYSISCQVYLGSANCYLGGRQYYYPWS